MSTYHSVDFSVKKDGAHLADFDESFSHGLKFYCDEDITELAADALININMYDTEGEYEVSMKFYYDLDRKNFSHTVTVLVEQSYVVQVTRREILC